MGSVFNHRGAWTIKHKDATGRWVTTRTKAPTKMQAAALLAELENRVQRQLLGLEARQVASKGLTVGDLVEHWQRRFGRASRDRVLPTLLDKHILPRLKETPVVALDKGACELFLVELTGLSARSINRVRAFMRRVFVVAEDDGLWSGTNPWRRVELRREPRRTPQFLHPDEVPRVIAAVPPRWRAMFATAIHTGLRKGELLGLRKEDVDVQRGVIRVRWSYDRNVTKGGHEDLLPISNALRPLLVEAMRSPGPLVFPTPDGDMQSHKTALQRVLRAAMARAGLVDHWRHACRRKGCGFKEVRRDGEVTPCPRCGFRLWPSPVSRPLRLHDLRHTTATLLLKAGASLAVVQRVCRHASPETTANVYGHLDMGDLKLAVDLLPLGEPVVNGEEKEKGHRLLGLGNPSQDAVFVWSGRHDSNVRLPAPKAGGLPG